MAGADHRHGKAGHPLGTVRQVLVEPAGDPVRQGGNDDLVTRLGRQQVADRPHRIVLADGALHRRTQPSHPVEPCRQAVRRRIVIADLEGRWPHPALDGKRLGKGDDDIGPVSGRHQQREPGGLRGHPILDHLRQVVTAQRLIRHDQNSTHDAHLFLCSRQEMLSRRRRERSDGTSSTVTPWNSATSAAPASRSPSITYGNWLTHGSQVENDVAAQCVRAALDAGITSFDTADVYANGAAESVLGEALKGERRESLEIFTKVYWPTGPKGHNDVGLSRKHIAESINLSLTRLQTDYVDLYQAHRFDTETPLEETMQAFARSSGRARRCTSGSANGPPSSSAPATRWPPTLASS